MRRLRIDPDAWRLVSDGAEDTVTDVRELRRLIAAALRNRFAEVLLVRGECPEHNLFALFNDGNAVMSYTRNIDEASYCARKDDRPKREGEVLEFYFSNGQRDEYPLAETIPSEDAVTAFEYFFQRTELAPWIKWQQDF